MAISESRKKNAAGLIVLMLIGTAMGFGPAAMASMQTDRFCQGLAPRASEQSVRARAEAERFHVTEIEHGRLLVEHRWSLGRAYCVVKFDEQQQLASISLDP